MKSFQVYFEPKNNVDRFLHEEKIKYLRRNLNEIKNRKNKFIFKSEADLHKLKNSTDIGIIILFS